MYVCIFSKYILYISKDFLPYVKFCDSGNYFVNFFVGNHFLKFSQQLLCHQFFKILHKLPKKQKFLRNRVRFKIFEILL